VLRYENTVLRRQVTGQVRYKPAHRFWFAVCPHRSPDAAGATSFPFNPRRSRSSSFAWPTKTCGGTQEHPGRTGRTRTSDRRIDCVGDLERGRDDPAPRRAGLTWTQFLVNQARGTITADFSTSTPRSKRLYALVFLKHGTRRLHVAGVTANPTQDGTTQQAATSPPTLMRGWARTASCSATATRSTRPPSTLSFEPTTWTS
jgi:hypothetical protein